MRKIRKRIIITIMTFFVLFMIGMIRIETYDFYEVPSLNTDILNDEQMYTKISTGVSYEETCSCVITVDYYKANDAIDNYDLYTLLVTFEINLDDDVSTQVVQEFDSISKILIRSDVSTYENGYLLSDYMMTDWSINNKGWDISFSFNNLIGKKDISSSLNQVGYMHSGSSSVEGRYNGEFQYNDYTIDSKVQTLFTVGVPKGEPVDISLEYKIEMSSTMLYPFSIKDTDIVGDWSKVGLKFDTKSTD